MRNPSLSRRDFLKSAATTATVSAFVVTGLSACAVAPAPANAPAQGGATPVQETVTLRKMAWGSPLEKANIESGLAKFMDQNPGITVEYIHTPDRYQEVLQTMLSAGDAPDVYKMAGYYPDLAVRESLIDITDWVKSDDVLGDPNYFFPFEEARSTVNGRWYGIGSTFQWRLIYYSKALFDAAGIEPPSTNPAETWSWDKFLEVATLLTVDSQGKHPGEADFNVEDVQQWGIFTPDAMYDNYIFSNGSLVIDGDSQKYVLDQPAAYEAVQAFADLRLKNQVAAQASVLEQMGMNAWQMLGGGRVAMIQDGNWALQDISKAGFEFGVGIQPMLAEPASVVGSSWTGIYSKTEHPDEAWQLFRYLNLDDYQAGLVRVGLWGVSHQTLLTPEGVKTWWDPAVHPENWLPLEADYKLNYGHVIPNVIGALKAGPMITQALGEVWVGTRTAEDVLTELNPQLNQVLEEEQARI